MSTPKTYDVPQRNISSNVERWHGPENILVVHIEGDVLGKEVADYYASVRNIPAENVFACPHTNNFKDLSYDLGLNSNAVLNSVYGKIDSLSTPIRGIQLCGDWPTTCSYWKWGGNKPKQFSITTQCMFSFGRRLQRLFPTGSLGTEPLTQGYYLFGGIGGLENFLPDIERTYIEPTDDWRQGPLENLTWRLSEVSTTIPAKDSERHVYSCSAFPIWGNSTAAMTIDLIDRTLIAEARNYEDFGRIVVVDSTSDSMAAPDQILNEMEVTNYPTDEFWYYSSTSGINSPPEGVEVFLNANLPDYVDITSEVGLYMMGNENVTRSTYYHSGDRPYFEGEQKFRDGAVCCFTQSSPGQNEYDFIWEWGDVLPITTSKTVTGLRSVAEGIGNAYTSSADAALRMKTRSGIKEALVAFFVKDETGVVAAQVIADKVAQTLTFQRDTGSGFVTDFVLDHTKTVLGWYTDFIAQSDWEINFASGQCVPRTYQAIRDNAVFAYGAGEEPQTIGHAKPRDLITALWAEGSNISEWFWKYTSSQFSYRVDASGGAVISHCCIGDLLYRPFTAREGYKDKSLNLTSQTSGTDVGYEKDSYGELTSPSIANKTIEQISYSSVSGNTTIKVSGVSASKDSSLHSIKVNDVLVYFYEADSITEDLRSSTYTYTGNIFSLASGETSDVFVEYKFMTESIQGLWDQFLTSKGFPPEEGTLQGRQVKWLRYELGL